VREEARIRDPLRTGTLQLRVRRTRAHFRK